MTSAGARKPPRVRRRVARCASPYSTDSNYEGPDTAPRRRPQRRRQPRHQQGASTGTGSTATTGNARLAATGDAQPSPANNTRPRPPPIAAKPRGKHTINYPLAALLLNFRVYCCTPTSVGRGIIKWWAVSVCLSVRLSVACLDLTRERKGLESPTLAGWRHGWWGAAELRLSSAIANTLW